MSGQRTQMSQFWALRFAPAARLPSNQVSWPVHAVALQRRWLPIPVVRRVGGKAGFTAPILRRAFLNLDSAALMEASGILCCPRPVGVLRGRSG
jgi:hypothetical protein